MRISKSTYDKFRISELTIKEYENWLLLTRTNQCTLGSLVLISKSGTTEFGDISAEELSEMGSIIKEIEDKLKLAFNWDKMNYLMLMMKDPEVHFHINPRYKSERKFGNNIFYDQAFNPPKPALSNENNITNEELLEIHKYLKELFSK